MKRSINNKAPEDSRSGDVPGGSYARERSSGVLKFKGWVRGKPTLIYMARREVSGLGKIA
ncbi:MAG: hypothetical protein ABSB79_15865 [Syntrophales bacterium]|jgi:hypothetical protein